MLTRSQSKAHACTIDAPAAGIASPRPRTRIPRLTNPVSLHIVMQAWHLSPSFFSTISPAISILFSHDLARRLVVNIPVSFLAYGGYLKTTCFPFRASFAIGGAQKQRESCLEWFQRWRGGSIPFGAVDHSFLACGLIPRPVLPCHWPVDWFQPDRAFPVVPRLQQHLNSGTTACLLLFYALMPHLLCSMPYLVLCYRPSRPPVVLASSIYILPSLA